MGGLIWLVVMSTTIMHIRTVLGPSTALFHHVDICFVHGTDNEVLTMVGSILVATAAG